MSVMINPVYDFVEQFAVEFQVGVEYQFEEELKRFQAFVDNGVAQIRFEVVVEDRCLVSVADRVLVASTIQASMGTPMTPAPAPGASPTPTPTPSPTPPPQVHLKGSGRPNLMPMMLSRKAKNSALKATPKPAVKKTLETEFKDFKIMCSGADMDLQKYIGENGFMNILKFWHDHEEKFSCLAKLACVWYGALASEAPSERVFSGSGMLLEKDRAATNCEMVDHLRW